jgi:hypothetical protein
VNATVPPILAHPTKVSAAFVGTVVFKLQVAHAIGAVIENEDIGRAFVD